tara:strand:+ start:141 stop:1475 length:1335 start_codon:yes stop_codon:yes gene_type:complete
MTTKFGFFKEWIQRATGTGNEGESYTIRPTSTSSNTLRFIITSSVTTSPTISYAIQGIDAQTINESLTGTVTLNSTGSGEVNISLVTTYDVGVDDSVRLELRSSTSNFFLARSSYVDIVNVGELIYETTGVVSELGNPSARTLKYLSSGTFKITSFSPDPFTGVIASYPDLRVIMVGGGGAGESTGSTGAAFGQGGGGGGFLDQSGFSTSNLNLDEAYNITVGIGGVRNSPGPDDSENTGGDSAIYLNGNNQNPKYRAFGGHNGNGGYAFRGYPGAIEIDGVTTQPTGARGPSSGDDSGGFAGTGTAGGGGSFFTTGGTGVPANPSQNVNSIPGRGANGTAMYPETYKVGAGGGSCGFNYFAVNPLTVSSDGGSDGGGKGAYHIPAFNPTFVNAASGYANSGSGGGGALNVYSYIGIPGGNGGSGRVNIFFNGAPQYRAFAYVT